MQRRAELHGSRASGLILVGLFWSNKIKKCDKNIAYSLRHVYNISLTLLLHMSNEMFLMYSIFNAPCCIHNFTVVWYMATYKYNNNSFFTKGKLVMHPYFLFTNGWQWQTLKCDGGWALSCVGPTVIGCWVSMDTGHTSLLCVVLIDNRTSQDCDMQP